MRGIGVATWDKKDIFWISRLSYPLGKTYCTMNSIGNYCREEEAIPPRPPGQRDKAMTPRLIQAQSMRMKQKGIGLRYRVALELKSDLCITYLD